MQGTFRPQQGTFRPIQGTFRPITIVGGLLVRIWWVAVLLQGVGDALVFEASLRLLHAITILSRSKHNRLFLSHEGNHNTNSNDNNSKGSNSDKGNNSNNSEGNSSNDSSK
jgi:hypothetical protein